MAVYINRDTNLAEDVAPDTALKGNYGIPLLSPEGESVNAPHTDAPDLIKQGYTQPDTEHLKSLLDYAKNQETGEKLKAAGQGALSGVITESGTSALLSKMVAPEDIRRRSESGYHTAGQLAGLVGSSMIGVGEGALLEKAGAAAGSMLPQATSTIGRIGTAAAKMAVENAVFQGDDELSKAWLKDPHQSIETAAANIGIAGILGAVTGGAMKGTGELWAQKMGPKLAAALDTLKQAPDLQRVMDLEKGLQPTATPHIHNEVPADEFHNKIQEILANPNPLYKANITPYSAEDYAGFKTFLAPDKQSGYAIKPDGELISVFSTAKGRGSQLVDDAVLNKGATKLDAFDINGKLPSLYGKYMDETSRMKFADEYAPKDWDYEKIGRPDVVNMALNPGKVSGHSAGLGQLNDEIRAVLGDSPTARKIGQELYENPTSSIREKIDSLRKRINDFGGEVLGHDESSLASFDPSLANQGQKVVDAIKSKVGETLEPAGQAISDIRDKFAQQELTVAEKTQIAEELAKLHSDNGFHKISGDANGLVLENTIKDIAKQDNVADLSKLASNIGKRAQWGADNYYGGKLARGALNDAIDRIIERRLPGQSEELAAKWAQAKKDYGASKDLFSELNDRLHAGRGAEAGAQSIKQAIDELGPEKALERLRIDKDTRLQQLLSTEMPEVAQAVKEFKINKLIKQSMAKDGSVDITKLSKRVSEMEPEARNFILSAVQQKKIAAAHDLALSIPARINPSGTAGVLGKMLKNIGVGGGIALGNHLGGPLGAITGGAIGWGLKEGNQAVKMAALRFMGSAERTSAPGFKALAKFADAVAKGEKLMTQAAKSVLPGASKLALKQNSTEELKKQVDKYAENPAMLNDADPHLGHYGSDFVAAGASHANQAMQYLASQRPNTMPLSQFTNAKTVPSLAQKLNYESALHIAQNPLSLAEKVRNGSISPRDMQHAQIMFPSLVPKLQGKIMQEVVQHVSDGGSIPLGTQHGLAVLNGTLGQKQPNIFAAQPLVNNAGPQQQAPQSHKPAMNSLKHAATSYETPGQAREIARTTSHR